MLMICLEEEDIFAIRVFLLSRLVMRLGISSLAFSDSWLPGCGLHSYMWRCGVDMVGICMSRRLSDYRGTGGSHLFGRLEWA